MSTSDEIVMQKKDATTPVTWSDYEHLRDHLTGMFDKSTSKLEEDVQQSRSSWEKMTKLYRACK
jgi:Na+/phosphate symporter